MVIDSGFQKLEKTIRDIEVEMYVPKRDKKAKIMSLLSPKKKVDKKKVSPVTPEAHPKEPLMEHISQMANVPNPTAHAAILNRTPANQQSSNKQFLLQLQQQYGNSYVKKVLQLAQQEKQGDAISQKELENERQTVPSKQDKDEKTNQPDKQLSTNKDAKEELDKLQLTQQENQDDAILQKALEDEQQTVSSKEDKDETNQPEKQLSTSKDAKEELDKNKHNKV
ncbi:hypothetical protein WA1_40835 [Scytonema hofmannii PCC 7110]|uniref:Uncharacterized protein n=1 Tax=Scytonema hofmannii PCC 7110 TaxID=128403 RepID=A0A139WUG5_9CYAN|nr:hypothetical protein [Scytonema hofmannii]KYC36088.1 hypothetical protein WA1_40835 [Scytonema hofmannii PCC 7110]